MRDRLDRVVRVGDAVSMRCYDNGTVLRVMAIDDNVMYVKRAYRGRKIFPIRFLKRSSWPRCDFTIVNR